MKTTILAVGKWRGPEAALGAEYHKRLGGKAGIKEIPSSTQKTENDLLLQAIPAKAFVILCDERGKEFSSRDFAAQLAAWQQRGTDLAFVIGGADGVTDAIRQRADFVLSFGRATWPHRLARVMLLEQLYRARQIAAAHPYHRD
ncbi:MAG TPA: 23S rRNA (pseudouridine(1915)-N(3))-methyltransferase RlmH [Alphaproteobacteria bacterium]|nr:23S rRNA (pseudouridine(1915)-N(3))-methyltransferase RlmH [Alphaproteobacteria bacterium]